jgi:hypothetical protein
MAHKRRTITIVSTDSSENDDVFYDAVVDDVVDDVVEDGNDDEEVVVVQQRRPFTSTPKPPNKRSLARAKTGGCRKEVRRTWEPRPQPRPRSSPKWLMEIKHFQRSVKLLVPRKPFRRLVSFLCLFIFSISIKKVCKFTLQYLIMKTENFVPFSKIKFQLKITCDKHLLDCQ